jgi:hypothetical protein
MRHRPGRIPPRGASFLDRQRAKPSRPRGQIIPIHSLDASEPRVTTGEADASSPSAFVSVDLPDAWQGQELRVMVERHERSIADKLMLVRTHQAESWFSEAEAELLDAYETASTDNWDDEGSDAMTKRAWNVAHRLLRAIDATAPKPEIGIGRRGQVMLDWLISDRNTLTVEVHSDGHCVYAALYGGPASRGSMRGVIDEAEVTANAPDDLELALARLNRHANGSDR